MSNNKVELDRSSNSNNVNNNNNNKADDDECLDLISGDIIYFHDSLDNKNRLLLLSFSSNTFTKQFNYIYSAIVMMMIVIVLAHFMLVEMMMPISNNNSSNNNKMTTTNIASSTTTLVSQQAYFINDDNPESNIIYHTSKENKKEVVVEVGGEEESASSSSSSSSSSSLILPSYSDVDTVERRRRRRRAVEDIMIGQVPPLDMGPMVGHTTYNSVTLWAYHKYNYTMEIILYESGKSGSGSDTSTSTTVKSRTPLLSLKIYIVEPSKKHNNAIIAKLGDLESNTSYDYEMHIKGERVGKGRFRTAPPWRSPNKNGGNNGYKFDYILTSCMNYRRNKNQIVWKEGIINTALNRTFPDFAILAGDTIYLDSKNNVDISIEDGVRFDRVWYRNQEQRSEKHFAHFISNTPIYSTWNDHEFGANDCNKDQKGKVNSLKAWESLWANPGYGIINSDDTENSSDGHDGVFYSFYWGDVHFIVTDDHWYRNPETKNRLGTIQTEWLSQELINSSGIFKVIVIGSDIMQKNWTSDLYQIGAIVKENSINGVIFHAGDIHRNEFKRRVGFGFPYPVTQITSSGIAKVWRRPFVHIKVDTKLLDPTLTAHFYGATNRHDYDSKWTNDQNSICSNLVYGIDRDKEHSCTETIRLSDLQV